MFSEQKKGMPIPGFDDVRGRSKPGLKIPNSNRFDLMSAKGGRSNISGRSKGPSVSGLLAQSVKSIGGHTNNLRSAMANRHRAQGAPDRSVSKGFDGTISAKKFDFEDLPDVGARRAQP